MLEIATGKVIGSLHRRPRAVVSERLPAKLDKQAHSGLDVHLTLDRYGTHRTPALRQWPPAHPRCRPHFAPTSSPWLNQVERGFAELTRTKPKRGVHRCVQALARDIRDRLADRNEPPWPCGRTDTADEIPDEAGVYGRRVSDSGHLRELRTSTDHQTADRSGATP